MTYTLDDFTRRGGWLFCPEPEGWHRARCDGHSESQAAEIAEIATFGEYPYLTCVLNGSLMVRVIRRIQALEAK